MGKRSPPTEPVFVCGLGRSGTTWISRSLGQSPELTYIGEAWLVRGLAHLADWFAMIHDDWADFTPWSRAGIDRRAFVDSLAGWYRELLTRAAGGHRFIEKTPGWNAQQLGFLSELFPDAYYVLVCRDGRNCVASHEAHHARRQEPFDFAQTCRRWAAAVDVFDEVRRAQSIRRVTTIRYEDLLRDFDAVFIELCAFTEIPPFRPEPQIPNSAFPPANDTEDFTSRWHAWSIEQRSTFKQYAGRQLIASGYASDASW